MNKISVSISEDFASTVNDIKLAIQHLTSSEIRQTASAESALTPIRQIPSAEFGIEPENAFL